MKLYYRRPIDKEHATTVVAYMRCNFNDYRSLSKQQRAIYEYCEENDLFIEAEYIDIGYSANNPNRPGLQQLLIDTSNRDNRVAQVLIYDFSRLSRNYAKTLEYELALAKSGVEIVSVLQADNAREDDEQIIESIKDFFNHHTKHYQKHSHTTTTRKQLAKHLYILTMEGR